MLSWTNTFIEDRYQVIEKIAQGGFGEVYRAHDTKMDRHVAIKVPRQSWLEEPDFAERYRREIQSMVQLNHLHIVRVYDHGEHDGRPFAVLEFLEAGTLSDRREASYDFHHRIESLRDWLPQIASALDYMHGKGYIHRDMKSSNVLFDGEGNAYLTDFGIAKAVNDKAGMTITASGHAMGTVEYMAPEICRGEKPTGHVDQYALAVVAYEWLSGEYPIRGATPIATIALQDKEIPTPLSQKISEIPKAVSEAVSRGLAKQPEKRFADCSEFAEAVLTSIAAPVVSPAKSSNPTGITSSSISGTPPASTSTEKIRTSCPACGKKIAAPINAVGRKFQCPRCQERLEFTKSGCIRVDEKETGGHSQAAKTDTEKSRHLATVSPFVDVPEVKSSSSNVNDVATKSEVQPAPWYFQKWWQVSGAAVLLIALFSFATSFFMGPEKAKPTIAEEQSPSSLMEQEPATSTQPKPAPPPTQPSPVQPDLLESPFSESEAIASQRAWSEYLKEPVELTNSIGMQFALIPAGEFKMGSDQSAEEAARTNILSLDISGLEAKYFKHEHPQHRVRITQPFYMGAHEVTNAQYCAFLNDVARFDEKWIDADSEYCQIEKRSGRWWIKGGDHHFGAKEDQPMVEVSWHGAVAFADWLSKKEGVIYRLPTEAEWEYACRAGTTTPFHFGNVNNGRQANVDGNYPYGTETKGPYLGKTTPVGSYAANAFDLYDMHGNVREWCQDWYASDYYSESPVNDPQGPISSDEERRVLRGGAWNLLAKYTRSAFRSGYAPGNRDGYLGFRLLRTK